MPNTALETDRSYFKIVQELEGRGVMPDRPPSLGVIHEALGQLKHPIDPRKVVLIAGTNGKGSTAASLEALLLSAGKKVGLYTSPHLMDTVERIRLNGREIQRSEFVELFQKVNEEVGNPHLTHFEMLTLMAHQFFALKEVDYALFEVGLGGTWDATNAIPHHFCAIAEISFDHQHILGDTLEEIAANKFGIVSQGSQVVHLPLDSSLESLAGQTRDRTGSDWTVVKRCEGEWIDADHALKEPSYKLRTPWGEVFPALIGQRMCRNLSLALTVFEKLGFDPMNFLSALEKIRWGGRMERLDYKGFPVSLSGDHNEQGIQSLLEILPHFKWNTLHILAGVGIRKDLNPILRALFDIPRSRLILTQPSFQGRSKEEYGDWIERAAAFYPSPSEALDRILEQARDGDRVLVSGSLYLVGDIRKKIMLS